MESITPSPGTIRRSASAIPARRSSTARSSSGMTSDMIPPFGDPHSSRSLPIYGGARDCLSGLLLVPAGFVGLGLIVRFVLRLGRRRRLRHGNGIRTGERSGQRFVERLLTLLVLAVFFRFCSAFRFRGSFWHGALLDICTDSTVFRGRGSRRQRASGSRSGGPFGSVTATGSEAGNVSSSPSSSARSRCSSARVFFLGFVVRFDLTAARGMLRSSRRAISAPPNFC